MKPLISYYGGKQRLAKWIISHFPEHKSYIEPFCGGAAVFFAKEPVQLNVLNDTNGHVVNLYRQAKLNPDGLFRLIDATPHSRSEYERAAAIYKGKIEADDLERAWATYTAIMQAFGKKAAHGWAFESKFDKPNPGRKLNRSTSKWGTQADTLPAILAHLDNAQIDSIDALSCIERYDDEHALFYIDPPYVGAHQGHYAGYTQQDFDNLLELLTTIKGTFFLSHYANEQMQQYAEDHGWECHEKEAFVSAGKRHQVSNDARRTELLVTNHTHTAIRRDGTPRKPKPVTLFD